MASRDPGGGRALTLDDRAAIEQALGRDGHAPSEHCFANLYLFRERHSYRLVDGPVPHIRGITYDGERHALALVPLNAAAALLDGATDCLFPLGAEAPALAAQFSLGCDYREADSDYLFDGSTMAGLARAKTRRAQARAFAARHSPVLEPWSAALATEATAVLRGWLVDVKREEAATDARECREAIRHADALGLEGGLVRTAGGAAVAFLLASARNDGVRVVHFAKGRRAHSAAYPWMFAAYAGATNAALMNFEQDLGHPGLARSKRAYAPSERRPKYRLRRRAT